MPVPHRPKTKKATMSEGARLLLRALERRKLSQEDLGSLVDTDQPTVSRWLRGERKPSLPFALKLQAKLRIPIASWEQSAAA